VRLGAFLIAAPLIALITWRLTFTSTFSTTDAEGSATIFWTILDRRRLAAWETDWRASNLSGPAGASPGR
jgi:hypothetical protein